MTAQYKRRTRKKRSLTLHIMLQTRATFFQSLSCIFQFASIIYKFTEYAHSIYTGAFVERSALLTVDCMKVQLDSHLTIHCTEIQQDPQLNVHCKNIQHDQHDLHLTVHCTEIYSHPHASVHCTGLNKIHILLYIAKRFTLLYICLQVKELQQDPCLTVTVWG